MARAAALKVYVTPAGFYDAVVAAPNQKAALEAWGARSDLFGEKLAALEPDEAWRAKALASPGEVVRKPRGDPAALLATPAPKRSPPAKSKAPTRSARRQAAEPKPKPAPDRSRLDVAEAALETARGRLQDVQADCDRRRRELDAEEARATRDAEADVEKARAAKARAESAYDRQLKAQ